MESLASFCIGCVKYSKGVNPSTAVTVPDCGATPAAAVVAEAAACNTAVAVPGCGPAAACGSTRLASCCSQCHPQGSCNRVRGTLLCYLSCCCRGACKEVSHAPAGQLSLLLGVCPFGCWVRAPAGRPRHKRWLAERRELHMLSLFIGMLINAGKLRCVSLWPPQPRAAQSSAGPPCRLLPCLPPQPRAWQ